VKLVAALTGQEAGAPGMNAVMAGTLNEVGNILLNGVMGTIANILEKPFEYTFPSYLEGSLEHLLASPEITRETLALMVQTNFAVREMQIEGNVFLLLELKAFETLVGMLNDLFKGTLH
jgi:chemotaxis protein CheC